MGIDALINLFKETYSKHQKEIVKELSKEDHYNSNFSDWEEWERKEYPERAELTKDELIAESIDDRFYDWLPDFRSHAKEEKGKLKLFRCISVEDADEFTFFLANGEFLEKTKGEHYKGIGIYWSWDERRAECHWGGNSPSYVTVHGLVDIKDIDILDTVLMNLNPTLGRDEAEIRLNPGAKVEIIAVEQPTGEIIDNDTATPLMVPASCPVISKILIKSGPAAPTKPSRSRQFKLYEELEDQKHKGGQYHYIVEYNNGNGTFDIYELTYTKGDSMAEGHLIKQNSPVPYTAAKEAEIIHDYEFEDRVGPRQLIRLIFELADASGETDLETDGKKGFATLSQINITAMTRDTLADLGYIKLYAKDLLHGVDDNHLKRQADRIIDLVDSIVNREGKVESSLDAKKFPTLAKLTKVISSNQFPTVQNAIDSYYYEPDVDAFIQRYMEELPEQLAMEGQKAWDQQVAIQQSLNKYARGDKPAYDGMTQEQIDNAKAVQAKCIADSKAYSAAADLYFQKRKQG